MACKKQGVLFSGTKEQEAALKEVISELKGTKGALMPIMQKAQDIYGYLPIEVQTMISDETGIPLEKIYGVATVSYTHLDVYKRQGWMRTCAWDALTASNGVRPRRSG